MNDTVQYLLNKYNLGYDENTVMPIEIPNVSRLDIVRWIRELDFRVGVEVGVAQGEFSKLIVVGNEQVHLYGVDPWEPYQGYKDYVKQESFNDLYSEAQHRLQYFKRFEFVRKYSMDAVKDFEDNSLDFVYIDANHEYEYVKQDITEWTKKIRSGGIVCGHDYVNLRTPLVEGERVKYGIKRAVQEYTAENNICPWFVLGLNAEYPRLVREGIRSWAFVK
jgi:hypothetical protein